jgi:hypothetical protein
MSALMFGQSGNGGVAIRESLSQLGSDAKGPFLVVANMRSL